jgi:hypothetical protein
MSKKTKKQAKVSVEKKPKNSNLFKIAVENTPDIANCYQSGLQALGKYSKKIDLAETTLCSGSVEIDECTKAKYPNDPRWDYALCYNSEVFFVEVHTANTSEVNAVLNKLQWLKDWLNKEAPEINKLKAKNQPYIWIQSNDFHIPKTSPQYRLAVQKGIKPIAKLSLK